MQSDRFPKVLLACAVILMAGCSGDEAPTKRQWAIDQCVRAELFKQCMTLLPAGPQSTKFNDWDDVVESCNDTSRSQASRRIEFVKSECQD